MFFRRKNKDRDGRDDPAARYGKLQRDGDDADKERANKTSFWSRLFGTGHDSDFVYHDD